MILIARLLFGYRDDLPLVDRWWHRLFKVLFILLTAVVGLFSIVLSYQDPPLMDSNITILDNLRSYTLSHPELANSLPSFNALGRTADLTDAAAPKDLYLGFFDMMCSADLKAHPEKVAEFIRAASPGSGDMHAAAALKWLSRLEASKGPTICIGKTDRGFPASDKIVAYKFTARAEMLAWAKAGLFSAAVLFIWILVLLNGYYRVLVYIVYGGRRVGKP